MHGKEKMKYYSEKFIKAAKTAKMPPEKFASKIKALLLPHRCRDTRVRLFSHSVLKALSFA